MSPAIYTQAADILHEKLFMDFYLIIGTSLDDIALSVEKAEKYLVKVLRGSSGATTFNELRYLLYHHGKKIAFTDLPPTSSSMKLHILRAIYHTHLQITCITESPSILDPCQFGYEQLGGRLIPKSVIELYPSIYDLVPNCTDIRCMKDGCNCKSRGKPCIPFCKCQVEGTCKNPFNE